MTGQSPSNCHWNSGVCGSLHACESWLALQDLEKSNSPATFVFSFVFKLGLRLLLQMNPEQLFSGACSKSRKLWYTLYEVRVCVFVCIYLLTHFLLFVSILAWKLDILLSARVETLRIWGSGKCWPKYRFWGPCFWLWQAAQSRPTLPWRETINKACPKTRTSRKSV